MSRVLIFLAFASLAGCATSSRFRDDLTGPERAAISASPYPHLKKRIDGLLADSLFPPANVGIKIVSLSRDEVLYELRSTFLFNPASNQKLLTSAAAFSLLGADYQFTTPLFIDSLKGSTILIRGSGDPLMTTSDLDSMAAVLSPFLRPDNPWYLAGDVSIFDDISWGKGWMWDDEPDPDAMFISPLSVNGNCIEIRVRPGPSAGDPVVVTTVPHTTFVKVQNTAITVTNSTPDSLVISRSPGEMLNLIRVTGTLCESDSPHVRQISIRKPEEFFLTLLAERLSGDGAIVAGIEFETARDLEDPIMVLSHPLKSVITRMNKESDNLCAEVLLKTLGLEMNHAPGTNDGGVSAIHKFLTIHGIDTTEVVIADGSGVSRYNLVAPTTIVEVLKAMYEDPDCYGAFYESLPIAGVDGTLSERMRGTPAQGNLRGKTGTLAGVSSLSGYVRTADGELLAFSMLMENFPAGLNRYRQVQDNIGTFLSRLRRESFEEPSNMFRLK